MIHDRAEKPMSQAEYRADPALARSELKLLLESPAKWRYRREHPRPPSPALAEGTALHAAVLEPETLGAVAAELFELRSEGGRKVFTPAQLDEAQFMAEAVLADPLARRLLTGRKEVSCFWTLKLPVDDGSLHEFRCKARPDVIGDGWCVDLKSTNTTHAAMFANDCERYGYDLQSPWYLMGACGQAPDLLAASSWRFVYVVVEKEPPYVVRFCELPASWRLAAWEKCRQALLAYWRATKPGAVARPRESEIVELLRPKWATMGEQA